MKRYEHPALKARKRKEIASFLHRISDMLDAVAFESTVEEFKKLVRAIGRKKLLDRLAIYSRTYRLPYLVKFHRLFESLLLHTGNLPQGSRVKELFHREFEEAGYALNGFISFFKEPEKTGEEPVKKEKRQGRPRRNPASRP